MGTSERRLPGELKINGKNVKHVDA